MEDIKDIENIKDIPLVQDLTIDVTESQIEVAYANQGDDKAPTINCHIQHTGTALDVSNYKVTLRVKKSNGKGYSATIGGEGIEGSVSGNIVSFKIPKCITISHGRQVCDLEFFAEDNTRKYSCIFYLRVHKGSLSDKEIMDSDYYASIHDEYLELKEDLKEETERATQRENEIDAKLDTEIARATQTDTLLDNKIQSEISRAKQAENALQNTIDANKPNWDNKYTRAEVDNKFSALESNIDWKEAVNSYSDIAATYPNPEDGWTVNVKDTDYTYRYNGTSWVAISANAIPKATNSVDGLLTKEDHAKYEDANTKKHTHDNKSVLDEITSASVTAWNTAEVNQNAFSNVKVGSSTIAAGSKTDTLELVAGNNITLTPDTANDKITISANGDSENVKYADTAGKVSNQLQIEYGKKPEAIGFYDGSSKMNVTIPIKTSDLTNDSGFVNFNAIYPVGSIYLSATSTSPATLFGGTWVQITTGYLKAGTLFATKTNGDDIKTGSTTLTAAQSGIPAHNHGLNSHTHTFSSGLASENGAHTHTVIGTISSSGKHTHTFSNGSAAENGAHTHTPMNSSNKFLAYAGDNLRAAIKFANNTSGNYYGPMTDSASNYGTANTCSSSGKHTHTVSGTISEVTDHTHTFSSGLAAENGAHTHTVTGTIGSATGNTANNTGASASSGHTHDINLNYVQVYMWRRTA